MGESIEIAWNEAPELDALRELVELIDERDEGLANHSLLVSEFAARTARALGLDPRRVVRVAVAGMVHDIGKVALPDSILSKPGPLTAEEWEQVRAHPEDGARLILAAGLVDVAEWVLTHHERVDGTGYPEGRARDEIPLEARILAVVDAYEAMTSDRVYRRGMDRTDSRRELRRCAGTQFDEDVVEPFLSEVDRPD